MISIRASVLLAFTSLFFALPAFAVVPGTTLIEGVLHSSGGGPAADGNYKFTFSVYGGQTGGTAAWQEKDVSLKVTSGRFAYALGSTKAIDAAKVAGLSKAWLGIAVGADPELPRQPLHASMFAMYAKTAGSLGCKDCVGKDAISNGSITSAKVQFAYAKAADGVKGGAAADLKCTGCVSVTEIKWDGAVNLAGQALTAGKITSAGDVVAGGTVAGKQFIGDGSKLTGIKSAAGKCAKEGEVVKGINADGSLICVAGGLPPDGLKQVSNGQLSNQFVDTIPGGTKKKIPDNSPDGVLDSINFPDIGIAQKLEVNLDIKNSNTAELVVWLFPPNTPKLPAKPSSIIQNYPTNPTIDGSKYPHYVLHNKKQFDAKDKTIMKTVFPTKTKPVAGDIHKDWLNKNIKGEWRLLVLDTKYLNNQTDGELVSWNISVQTVSNKAVEINGDVYVKGNIYGAYNGHGKSANGVQLANVSDNKAPCDANRIGTFRYRKGLGMEVCETNLHKDGK